MKTNFEEELQKLIAQRAYELSQQRKNGNGDAFSDWLRAEQEIRHELNIRSDELFKNVDITNDEQFGPPWF